MRVRVRVVVWEVVDLLYSRYERSYLRRNVWVEG